MELQAYLRREGVSPARFAASLPSNPARQTIYRVVNGTRKAGPSLALEIEVATGGDVSRLDLRPDLYAGMEPAA